MKKVVFMVEELSMKAFLHEFLPKIIHEGIEYEIIPHQGKSDLRKSIPRKLLGWKGVDTFIILHDKDSHDCKMLKSELKEICKEALRPDTLIRIVCTELESWYLGNLNAVESAYNISLVKVKNKAKFRKPDEIANAKQELKKLVHDYQQIDGSRKIGACMTIENNQSHSFNMFVSGVKKCMDSLCT